MNKIIKEVGLKKATIPDKIPPKIIKIPVNVIDSHPKNIINSDIKRNSEGAKTASAWPVFKKNEREKVPNYRPVSILNCFSKIYEKYILKQFKPYLNDFLFQYMSAYRVVHYSLRHVLIRLIEHSKKLLMKTLLQIQH